jgi:hypothetical protein
MNSLDENHQALSIEEVGKVFVKNTRVLIENMAGGPVTVDFFESFMDEVCDHYNQYDQDYLAIVETLGKRLDQYLGEDRNKVVSWLETEGPEFGMAKPIELLMIGRGRDLINHVENLIKYNDPETNA